MWTQCTFCAEQSERANFMHSTFTDDKPTATDNDQRTFADRRDSTSQNGVVSDLSSSAKHQELVAMLRTDAT